MPAQYATSADGAISAPGASAATNTGADASTAARGPVGEEAQDAPIMLSVSEFAQPLREDDVDRSPVRQFTRWFEQAVLAGVRAPEAAAVATASTDCVPSVRMVLVKQADESGFVFYSNYESRKGRELAANPHGALLFHWDLLGRQVRIDGHVERTSPDESAVYVRSRKRASQLSALASPQSRTIDSRDWLEQRVAELAALHQGAELPLPDAWGGFRLSPKMFEFWQQRDDRLHDRLRYTHQTNGRWRLERLAP
jgi:pyridoxamine 5'-phosphate oxidase